MVIIHQTEQDHVDQVLNRAGRCSLASENLHCSWNIPWDKHGWETVVMAGAEFSDLSEISPSQRATEVMPLGGLLHISWAHLTLQAAAMSLSPSLSLLPVQWIGKSLLIVNQIQTEEMGGDSLKPLCVRRRGKICGERKRGERGKVPIGSKPCLQFSASSPFMNASKQDSGS